MVRLIERLFGTKIRNDERYLVALMTLDLFVLLASYYILKVVRDPLILLEGGVVERNAARGAQAVILLIAIPVYGRLADRIGPRRLVVGVFAFFLATLTAFPLLSAAGLRVGFVFFIWLGIFSITVIAQFWSLANDLFTKEAGQRLFAVIAAGGTLGAIVGAQLVAGLDRWLAPMSLLWVADALLAACILLTQRIRHRADVWRPAPPLDDSDARGGFSLVTHDRYLMFIAIAVLLLNLINTSGDQIMAMLAHAHAAQLPESERARYLTTFYANFQTWVSALTGLVQVFVVARLVRWVGIRIAVLVLPLIALTGYAAVVAVPTLMVVRALKVIENSADYSLQNTIQQMLFLPTSAAVKYKAKAATDTFFVRFGDLLSWAAVTVALALHWSARDLAIVNVSVAAVWLGVALQLGRLHRRLMPEPQRAERREPYFGVTA